MRIELKHPHRRALLARSAEFIDHLLDARKFVAVVVAGDDPSANCLGPFNVFLCFRVIVDGIEEDHGGRRATVGTEEFVLVHADLLDLAGFDQVVEHSRGERRVDIRRQCPGFPAIVVDCDDFLFRRFGEGHVGGGDAEQGSDLDDWACMPARFADDALNKK